MNFIGQGTKRLSADQWGFRHTSFCVHEYSDRKQHRWRHHVVLLFARTRIAIQGRKKKKNIKNCFNHYYPFPWRNVLQLCTVLCIKSFQARATCQTRGRIFPRFSRVVMCRERLRAITGQIRNKSFKANAHLTKEKGSQLIAIRYEYYRGIQQNIQCLCTVLRLLETQSLFLAVQQIHNND